MQTTLHAQPKRAPLSMTSVCGGVLQRKCACGGCSNKKLSLQRSTEDLENATRSLKLETQNSLGVPPLVHEVLRSPGQPLDSETRAFMEPRFRHDFGKVRVHLDAPAAAFAKPVGADAYAVGRDIVFATERYAPHAEPGGLGKGNKDNQMIADAAVDAEETSESDMFDEPEAAAGGGVLTSVVEELSPKPNEENELQDDDFGLTWPEAVSETVNALKSGAKWQVAVTALQGQYSKQTRLLRDMNDVTGPDGNTNSQNFCAQLNDLATFGNKRHAKWFMLDAVKAHENVHATRMLPALDLAAPDIQNDFKKVTVPDAADKTAATALTELKVMHRYSRTQNRMVGKWRRKARKLVKNDHEADGPTEQAERAVIEPMMKLICDKSREGSWGSCEYCLD